MKFTLKRTRLFNGLAAALFAMSAPVVLAQDDAEEGAEDTVELDRVVVVGGRVEQNIEDVAGSVSVMTSDDIENEMVNDMSQLFRYEPGIDITGSNGTAQNFIVRGMGADRVMMIKDGMRMNEGYGADGANDVVGRGFIDVDTIKQVEVAKGAASSLYGADAMGGIVAFATKGAGDVLAPGEDFFISANLGYEGTSDEIGAGFQTAFRLGSFETFINYKNRAGHETQNYTEERDQADVDSESILVKADYIIDRDKKLTFSWDYWLQEVDRPDDGTDKGLYFGLPGWQINFEDSYNEKENNSYALRYQDANTGLSFMDNVDINVYLNETDQRDEFHQNHDTPPPFGAGGYRDTIKSDLFAQETVGVSLSAGKVFGEDSSHQLSYGFDWDSTDSYRPRYETRTQSDGTVLVDDLSAPFPKNTTERLGIYLQNSVKLTERWTLTPGLRYDKYSMTPKADEGYDNANPGGETSAEKISDDNLSWRLGTMYDFTDNLSAYFTYSQGFKVPPYDLAYFYFDHVGFTGFGIRIIPANDLVPEESDSYEIGLRGSVGNLNYDFSAYYNDYTDFIQIAYIETVDEINWDFGFPFPIAVDVFQYQNIDEATISGFEFRLDYYLGNNFSMFFNGEYMDSEDKSTGDQLRSIRPFSGTLGVNYFIGDLSLDVMMNWADDMDKNPEDTLTTDDYKTFDMYARYNFSDRVQLSAGILNMFDKEYIEYSTVAGIPADGRDLTLYTEPGRTFSARIKVNF